MKVIYAAEAITDLLNAIEYLYDRSPAAAARLESEISDCIARLAEGGFDGPVCRLKSGSMVRSVRVAPFRIYYARYVDELLVVRVYHQARQPIAT